MSTIYQNFAYVYDKFMDNIPYDEWSQYLIKQFHAYSISCGTLVELGCGTGTMCKKIADAGYSVIGIDNSEDMLTIAADKLLSTENATLLFQDMTELNLGNTLCDGCYCVCDSLNYLLTPEQVLSTFIGARKYLKPDGIFIFDIKTKYFYETILGDQTFCEHQEDCSYTWENNYFEKDHINQYELTLFVKDENSDLFHRFFEIHHQRAYGLQEMIDLLKQSGLEYVTAYDAFTTHAPHPESERIYIIARNGDSYE